jgi:nanoRNase/pAp phosphatase (c-di-AMP/oligoRNAs hydrolase)
MRLITRSDFDGLACGTLLEALGLVNDWLFVHPKDIQDGLIKATDNDIVANVPYIAGCKLWFDHHSSEGKRLGRDFQFDGESRPAPSCAHVIYDYYGGEQRLGKFAQMVEAVDKMDSGRLSEEEIKNPTGWVLLGFICDPRTGLGRFRNFKVSNYDLMKKLASAVLAEPIDEILAMPDVKDRVDLYFEENNLFIEMVKKHAKIDQNVILVDLRGQEEIHAGNRFLLYTLYPEQNVSVWVVDGKQKINDVITVGYSVINRTCKVDIGNLMLKYGGGGHTQVGTCQIAHEEADKAIADIVAALKKER